MGGLISGYESQYDMNRCATSKADQADAELKQVYKQVLDFVKKDSVALNRIRKAQQAWIKFREAQMEMYHPPRPGGWYGSFQPVCDSAYYQTLTEDRTKQLKEWLEKPQEGDMCARS